ncbi:MAG: hypothetical protein M1377_08130 [Deltaproteobacteria bacterium]|nr:hypothetical protein [Deltaproteobacteria bacterium]
MEIFYSDETLVVDGVSRPRIPFLRDASMESVGVVNDYLYYMPLPRIEALIQKHFKETAPIRDLEHVFKRFMGEIGGMAYGPNNQRVEELFGNGRSRT